MQVSDVRVFPVSRVEFLLLRHEPLLTAMVPKDSGQLTVYIRENNCNSICSRIIK